jgi:hypothetical protein
MTKKKAKTGSKKKRKGISRQKIKLPEKAYWPKEYLKPEHRL